MNKRHRTASNLLKMLREAGRTLSDEELSVRLGISRHAVGKAVSILRKESYIISGTSKQGYELRTETEKLSSYGIESMLATAWDGIEVLIYDELDSSNTLAKKKLGDGRTYLIATESQTAGRGRSGRSFHSPAGSGLYFTLAFPWKREEASVMLTTMAAVAVAKVLETTFEIEVGIKWVNDLFLGKKKICGILTEAVREPGSDRELFLVVGIGINLAPPTDGFPEEIREKAGPVTDGKRRINRNKLIAEISNELAELIRLLPSRAYLKEYRDRCFILGREVVLDSGKTIIPEDISDDGGLVYFEAGERIELSSGEVRIKEYLLES